MKSKIIAMIIAALIILLTACASFLGSRDVNVPLSQLQQALGRKFPFNNRYLEIFDIQVSNPKLALQPDTNRIVTTMDASIAPPFMAKPWKGSFTLSGMLALDPVRHAVVLADPRMENFALDGVDTGSGYTKQIARIGGLLAEQILKDTPLYTFGPNDFRYAGASFLPSKITTTSNGLVVTFEPAS
jgi:hypothetical protein